MLLHHYIFYFMVGIEVLLLIPFSLHLKLFDKEQRIIYIYLISCVIDGLGGEFLARAFGNNLAFVSCMMLAQFIILSIYFLHVLKKPQTRKVIRWLIPFALLLFALDITVLEGPLDFNSIFISFRTFVLIIYGILFFLQMMRDESLIERSIFITSLPAFWFNSGLFVKLCCSFLLDLTFNFLQQGPPGPELIALYQITAGLTWVAGIIQAILFYIGLVKIKGVKS